MVPYEGDETVSAAMEPALIALEVLSIRSGSFLSSKIDFVNQPYHGKRPHIKILF